MAIDSIFMVKVMRDSVEVDHFHKENRVLIRLRHTGVAVMGRSSVRVSSQGSRSESTPLLHGLKEYTMRIISIRRYGYLRLQGLGNNE